MTANKTPETPNTPTGSTPSTKPEPATADGSTPDTTDAPTERTETASSGYPYPPDPHLLEALATQWRLADEAARRFRTIKKELGEQLAELLPLIPEQTLIFPDGYRLTPGRARTVINEHQLAEYLADDWQKVIPIRSPRIKALREVAQERGDDPALVEASYIGWKSGGSLSFRKPLKRRRRRPRRNPL